MSNKVLETITSIKANHRQYHLQVGLVLLSRHLLSIACNNMIRQDEYSANQLEDIITIKRGVWTRNTYTDGEANTLHSYAEDLSHELYIWLYERAMDNDAVKQAVMSFSRAVKYNKVVDDFTLHDAVGTAYSVFIESSDDVGVATHCEAIKHVRKLYRRKHNIIDRTGQNTQLQLFRNIAREHNETCDNYANAAANHQQLREYINRVRRALKADSVPTDWWEVVVRRRKGQTDEYIAQAYGVSRQAIQKKRTKIRALVTSLFTDDEKREFTWLMSRDSARVVASARRKMLKQDKHHIEL